MTNIFLYSSLLSLRFSLFSKKCKLLFPEKSEKRREVVALLRKAVFLHEVYKFIQYVNQYIIYI